MTDVHNIEDVIPGVFRTILDFPDERVVLDTVFDDTIPYVLLIGYRWFGEWGDFSIHGIESMKGKTSELRGDILIDSQHFNENHKSLYWDWAIQLESCPPRWFEFGRLGEPTKYRVLCECGFRFILEAQPGGGEYTYLYSQSKELLEKVISTESQWR